MLSKKASKIMPSSTLAITAKAKQMKADGIDVVGFGAGEPDFDTPEHIKQAAIEAINAGFTKYTPAAGIIELRKAVCNKLKEDHGLDYTPNQIVVSNGAKHSLINTFMAILNPGDEVIIPAPFWLSYTELVNLADGVPVIVTASKENQYKVTVDQLKQALTSKTKAILINSPSNPTGMIYSKSELQEIADFAVKNDLFVVSDEIYEKLVYTNEKPVSIASLGAEILDKTIVINGVSKSFAMTGWRIGYTASNAEIAKYMSNIQSHAASNPNSIAQKATLVALEGSEECIEVMKVEFNKRRLYMMDRINKIAGVSAIEPQGAFYTFVDLSDIMGKKYEGETIDNAQQFAKVLLEKANVAVVSCEDFGFPLHIRLSYAIAIQNIEKGLNRIEKFVNDMQ